MSLRLKSGESIDDGIRRILAELLGEADAVLRDREKDRLAAIHEARRATKKARAVLLLLRPGHRKVWRRENAALSEAARNVAGFREAAALVETMDRLAERHAAEEGNDFLGLLQEELIRRRDALDEDPEALERRIEQLRSQLAASRDRVDSLPAIAKRARVLPVGFVEVWRQGRAAMRTAYEERTPSDFHDWRKRVKYQRYHLRMLRGLWPAVMKGVQGELNRLGDLLGEHHDLTALRVWLFSQASLPITELQADQLVDWIDERRFEIEAEAAVIGRRVYAEKPKAFARRMQAYWSAWRQ